MRKPKRTDAEQIALDSVRDFIGIWLLDDGLGRPIAVKAGCPLNVVDVKVLLDLIARITEDPA
jgi:hypothetical protein